MSDIAALTGLATLSLNDNVIDGSGPNGLEQPANLTKLTGLSAKGNAIQSLSALRKLTGLTILKLARHRITDISALNNYLDGLEKAFLIYRAEQTDLTGKALLRPQSRFYPVDIGLRNLTDDFSRKDLGARLECAVYMGLLRRGYRATVGSSRSAEIDFVATRQEFTRMERTYVQVTASLIDEATTKRELAPPQARTDAFPRLVVTLDPSSAGTTAEGIEIVNALD